MGIDRLFINPHQYDSKKPDFKNTVTDDEGLCACRVPTNDNPTFYTAAGFADLRERAQCPLEPNFVLCTDSVPAVIGCGMNKCFCESYLERRSVWCSNFSARIQMIRERLPAF
jgi:hypothetical protein